MIKQFKIDVKTIKSQVHEMLKEYHTTVNQLLSAKQNLGDKISVSETQLTCEINRITNYVDEAVERIRKRKSMIIDELTNALNYRNKKLKDKYSNVLDSLEHLQDGWNMLNNFNSQVNKLSYEEFKNIQNINLQEFHQVALIVQT